MRQQRVLVLDDEKIGTSVAALLAQKGFPAEHFWKGSDALRAFDRDPSTWCAAVIDIVLTHPPGHSIDEFMGSRNGGMRVLAEIRKRRAVVPAIMLTACTDTVSDGERATLQISDVIAKAPNGPQRLAIELVRILHPDLAAARRHVLQDDLLDLPDLLPVLERVRENAHFNTHTLLVGEPGCGKEAIARYYFLHSGRAGHFVPISGATLSGDAMRVALCGRVAGFPQPTSRRETGAFEQAGHGVVYIGELDKYTDSDGSDLGPLFTATDERYVNLVGGTQRVQVGCAILASANDVRRIGEAILSRFDIIEVPPLRERPRDIQPLATHLRERFLETNAIVRPGWEVTVDRLDALTRHPLPCNIRTLLEWARSRTGFISDGAMDSSRARALHGGRPGSRAAADRSSPPVSATRDSLTVRMDFVNGRVSYSDYFGNEGILKREYWTWLIRDHQLSMRKLRRVTGQKAQDIENALRTFGLVAPRDTDDDD
jgi:DNA-binding NtrC family response regulator